MIRKETNGIAYLQFELLAEHKDVSHGVFLRGNDFTLSKGDREHVFANRKKAQEILNIPKLIASYQVHGADVHEACPEDSSETMKCDAFMTIHRNLGLMVKHADCQGTLIYDPVCKAIATVHSGWRGSIQNIYQKTIDSLQKRYGSHPKDLLVCIGPSLGPQSAEFIHYKKELPEPFWEYRVNENHFDFWEISKHQLIDCGVLPDHIEIAGIDTKTEPEDCFSYRRDKNTGHHGSIIALTA